MANKKELSKRTAHDQKCAFCAQVSTTSGIISHTRHKHPEKYDDFMASRIKVTPSIEKNTLEEAEPVQNEENTEKDDSFEVHNENPVPLIEKEKKEEVEPPQKQELGDVKPQKGKSFLEELDDLFSQDIF